MADHELQQPPEAGIAVRPPADSVVYASRLDGGTILGWIRAFISRGILTYEEVR